MEDELISLRKFARERGVSLGAVQKAIATKRVTAIERDQRGRTIGIYRVRAAEEWAANTDPVEAARTQGSQPAPIVVPKQGTLEVATGADPSQAGPESAAPAANTDQAEYLAARAKREGFQAKQAELEYLRAIGDLVPANEAREVAFRRYRTLRDKMLNIPERVASVIAAERDPARVHKLLTDEIKRVLHELSDVARAEVAGGVAERVAA